MMAASLKDGDALVNLLLSKGADVNAKSRNPIMHAMLVHVPATDSP